jgi:hypothetical protein
MGERGIKLLKIYNKKKRVSFTKKVTSIWTNRLASRSRKKKQNQVEPFFVTIRRKKSKQY